MASDIKVGSIGLDTSHSIEFTRRLQAPECPSDQRVAGVRVAACLGFATPFQDEAGLDARQKQIEGWGVQVTCDFDEAVGGCGTDDKGCLAVIEYGDGGRGVVQFTE